MALRAVASGQGTGNGGGTPGGTAVAVGEYPPAFPADGQLWWRVPPGQLFIWNPGLECSQWVSIGGGGGGGGGPEPPPPDMYQYKMQTHIHTTNSDGSVGFASVIEEHYLRGFDWLAITDHNSRTSSWVTVNNGLTQARYDEIIAGVGRSGRKMQPIPDADEVSFATHINTFEFTGTRVFDVNNLLANVKAAPPGWAQYNHATWTALGGRFPSDVGLKPPGQQWIDDDPTVRTRFAGYFMDAEGALVGLEVAAWLNTTDGPPDRRLWDMINTITIPQGRFAYGFGTDDSHGNNEIDWNWTSVFAKQNTLEAIRAGLKAGHSYVTARIRPDETGLLPNRSGTPPLIRRIQQNQAANSITITADNFTSIDWITTGTAIVATGNTISLNATPAASIFVRAVVRGADGVAFTQPMKVPVAADLDLSGGYPGEVVGAFSISINAIGTHNIGTAFAISGRLVGYTSAPTLQWNVYGQTWHTFTAGSATDWSIDLPSGITIPGPQTFIIRDRDRIVVQQSLGFSILIPVDVPNVTVDWNRRNDLSSTIQGDQLAIITPRGSARGVSSGANWRYWTATRVTPDPPSGQHNLTVDWNTFFSGTVAFGAYVACSPRSAASVGIGTNWDYWPVEAGNILIEPPEAPGPTISITAIPNQPPDTTFTVSGTLANYTATPSLQWQVGGAWSSTFATLTSSAWSVNVPGMTQGDYNFTIRDAGNNTITAGRSFLVLAPTRPEHNVEVDWTPLVTVSPGWNIVVQPTGTASAHWGPNGGVVYPVTEASPTLSGEPNVTANFTVQGAPSLSVSPGGFVCALNFPSTYTVTQFWHCYRVLSFPPVVGINPITNPEAGSAFTVDGTLSGYTSAPSLQWRAGGAWSAAFPATSTSAWSVTVPGIATPGTLVFEVRDAALHTTTASRPFTVTEAGSTPTTPNVEVDWTQLSAMVVGPNYVITNVSGTARSWGPGEGTLSWVLEVDQMVSGQPNVIADLRTTFTSATVPAGGWLFVRSSQINWTISGFWRCYAVLSAPPP